MQARPKLTVVQARTAGEELGEAIESFYRRCSARGLAAETIRFYRTRLDAFAHYLESQREAVRPGEITPPMVRDFLAAEKERLSAAAAHHARSTLSTFFRFLVAEEWLTANPMEKVERVRMPRKVVETFSVEQVEAMLAACNARSFNGTRLRAIVLVLLDCGLRVSELCGITLEAVSWDEGTLKVMGKGSKERVVPFGEATRQALLAYLSKRGNIPGQGALFVTCFGDAMNRHEAHRLLAAAGRKAGLTGVRCSPHTFRHTCAVMYLRNGGDAFSLQKLLGHSSLEMTRRYAELAQADVVAKHRQCSPGDRFLGAVRGAGGRKRLK